MNLGLHGKVALVTAASKGLGRASALALAAEGAQVMIAARHQGEHYLPWTYPHGPLAVRRRCPSENVSRDV